MPIVAPTIEKVLEARERIRAHVVRTPLIPLAGEHGNKKIFLKPENLQPFGSFKVRAAMNAIKSAEEEALSLGVVTASAGNFGQGLAAAARALGVPSKTFVPQNAADIKVEALERLASTVKRIPYEDWWHILNSHEVPEEGGLFIHPCAEQKVVEGNATIGLEIMEDLPEVDAVLVPVGGGGLITGIGSAIHNMKPDVKIIASESEVSQPVAAALKEGKPVMVPRKPTFIDGMGGPMVLERMWPLLREVVSQTALSSIEEIVGGIRFLALEHHLIAEGAGAAPVAVALAGQGGTGNIVCIISGGNIDVSHLRTILGGEMPG